MKAGVYFAGRSSVKPWYAQMTINGRRKTLGTYATEEEASTAYVKAVHKKDKDQKGKHQKKESRKHIEKGQRAGMTSKYRGELIDNSNRLFRLATAS